MPPKQVKEKRKKRSKEEIEAERIKAEQEAEEKRKIEELRIAEEKAAFDKAECLAQEARNILRSKELENLIRCYDEGLPINGKREKELKTKVKLNLQDHEWVNYLECNGIEWQNMTTAENFYAFESQLCKSALSLKDAVSYGEIICKIIAQIELQALWGDGASSQLHAMDSVLSFKNLISRIFEDACCNLLNRSELYTSNSGVTQEFFVEGSGHTGAGIWINASPVGKNKLLNFEKMGICLEISNLLAMSRVAVRLTSLPFKPIDSNHSSIWDTLGGTFRLDLLPLPPPYQKKGDIHVQQVHTFFDPLSMISDEAITFRIQIPKSIVLFGAETLLIGRWDDNQHEWRTDAVSNVESDMSSMTMSFQSATIGGIYAIIRGKSIGNEYIDWELSPLFEVGDSTGIQEKHIVVRYEIRSKRHCFIFLIREGYCTLVSPYLPQLQHLMSSKLLPKEMIRSLKDCGINISFLDSVVPNEKCLRVEERAYNDLSWLSSAFCARSSTYNAGLGSEKACYLLKESDFFVDVEDCEDDIFYIAMTERDSVSSTALGASEPSLKSMPSGCGTVKCTLLEYQHPERGYSSLNSTAIVEGTTAGIHMIQCIRPLCTAECIEREVTCSPLLANTVKQLLQLTRPLTCC